LNELRLSIDENRADLGLLQSGTPHRLADASAPANRRALVRPQPSALACAENNAWFLTRRLGPQERAVAPTLLHIACSR
jgi:hypothetical protein